MNRSETAPTAPRRAPVKRLFAGFAASLDAAVFPPVCLACQAGLPDGREPLCDACAAALATCVGGPHCLACGQDPGEHLLRDDLCTRCRGRRPRLFPLLRVGRYDGVLRRLILSFKSDRAPDRLLGRLAGELIAARTAGDGLVLAPVPSPWWRRFRRGFQPTELLAIEAARTAGAEYRPLLEMARRVPPQTGLSAVERVRNVRGAFRLIPGEPVPGGRICLVDDVMTTGATLREAARVLRQAGATGIMAIVLGVTPPAVAGGPLTTRAPMPEADGQQPIS